MPPHRKSKSTARTASHNGPISHREKNTPPKALGKGACRLPEEWGIMPKAGPERRRFLGQLMTITGEALLTDGPIHPSQLQLRFFPYDKKLPAKDLNYEQINVFFLFRMLSADEALKEAYKKKGLEVARRFTAGIASVMWACVPREVKDQWTSFRQQIIKDQDNGKPASNSVQVTPSSGVAQMVESPPSGEVYTPQLFTPIRPRCPEPEQQMNLLSSSTNTPFSSPPIYTPLTWTSTIPIQSPQPRSQTRDFQNILSYQCTPVLSHSSQSSYVPSPALATPYTYQSPAYPALEQTDLSSAYSYPYPQAQYIGQQGLGLQDIDPAPQRDLPTMNMQPLLANLPHYPNPTYDQAQASTSACCSMLPEPDYYTELNGANIDDTFNPAWGYPELNPSRFTPNHHIYNDYPSVQASAQLPRLPRLPQSNLRIF